MKDMKVADSGELKDVRVVRRREEVRSCLLLTLAILLMLLLTAATILLKIYLGEAAVEPEAATFRPLGQQTVRREAVHPPCRGGSTSTPDSATCPVADRSTHYYSV